MKVDFYHLGEGGAARVLQRIATRVLAEGGRLLVVCDDEAALAALDTALWAQEPESFLAHGRAGGGGEGDQPVLLATTVDPANGARSIALVDGRWRDEALGFNRAFHLFGEDQVAAAREAWRALAASGAERNFWRRGDDGRWEKLA